MRLFHRHFHPIIAAAVLLAAAADPAHSQYFGQNKVRYDTFDFKVIETEHFDVYFYPAEQDAAELAARMVERWYGRFSEFFVHDLSGRQPLILYASHPEFEQTNAISGFLGESTGGVTEALKRRIVLPFAGPLENTNHVLGHELVHAFQYDMTAVGGGHGLPGALSMPLWFIEGMSEYLSLGPVDAHTAMWLRDAASRDDLPDLRELDDPRFFPYRYGHAFLAYIGGRFGDERIAVLMKTAGRADIRTTFRRVLEVEPDSLVNSWHAATKAAVDSLRKATDDADRIADLVISEDRGGGTINIAPVLSPDGKKIIFFSEKDLFTINLYLADVETGKVERTIVERSRDPHLEGLQFIESAGAWAPDGDRVVIATVRKGEPALEIISVSNGKRLRRIPLPGRGEVLHPSWSPDGRSIAFSGLTGGLTDLFVYDLDSNETRRLTNDVFTDVQPAWSPDGTRIVCVTDRFSSDLAALDIGTLELAIVDPSTGETRELQCFDEGKHINPVWAADGRSIYFLSDRTGVTNVYRRDVENGEITQLTNLYTGVSGITALSPALSSASRVDRIAFSVFEGGEYNIYARAGGDTLPGEYDTYTRASGDTLRREPVAPAPPVRAPVSRERVTVLPPAERGVSAIREYLATPTRDLPAEKDYAPRKYRARLSLDYVSQPSFAVGASRLGTQLGGGTALFWSDMLGNHQIVTALQAQSNGTFSDIGGALGYENYKYRWSFGGSIQRSPYTTEGYAAGFGDLDGRLVYIEQIQSFRQTVNSASAYTQYPFSRATRLELAGGYEHDTFDQSIRTIVQDAETGELLIDQTEDLPAPPVLNLFFMSTAFVYDFSILGIASPIVGQRYRLEVTPVLGDLTYYTVLGDYRRYFLPVRPLTLAFRGLHYGRYGRDSASNRLSEYFIGYQTLVRGYDGPSFSGSECVGENGCPVYDRLFGNRIAIFNAEARAPLLGLLGLGGGYYGFLPLETALFFDAGVAWTPDDKASFLGGDRKIVKSYGTSIRLALSRYAVLTFDFVKPIDRPNKGWFWQFSLAPGF
jgi:Tol biopolymer transport system component